MGRWSWTVGTGVTALLTAATLLTQGPDEPWARWLAVAAAAGWFVAACLAFGHLWQKDYDDRFDDLVVSFDADLEVAYRSWDSGRYAVNKVQPPDAPNDWHTLVSRCNWVRAFADAESEHEAMLLDFAQGVYPHEGASHMADRYKDFQKLRKSMSKYWSEVGRARRGTPLRWWVRRTLRGSDRRGFLKMLLALEVALRYRRTKGKDTDIYDSPLARIPGLF